jgi:drug/metabolite transporter (DMT)-like permease
MSALALGLVLLAAFLHASWNAMVKAVDDRAGILAGVSAVHVLVGVGLVSISPLPEIASWPSIVISTLVHYGYYMLIFYAYRFGDLSQVYPISRGMAPAIVALGALVLIGEVLPLLGWIGLAMVCLGIGILALQRGALNADRESLYLASALGCTIAVYSVADGIGVRLSGSPSGYIGWLFLLEAPVPLAIALKRTLSAQGFSSRTVAAGVTGGIFAATAYGLVLYVKTIAPIGAVSAVRESSVVIAAIIGILIFGERPWKGRLVAAVIVAAGVVTLAAS